MNSIFRLSNIKSEFKSSIKLAIPLIGSEVIYALNGFIATMMVAHLGKVALAANALVWGIYLAVILFFMGMLCSVSILVAQSFGVKDNVGIGICFKQGLILSFIFAIPMMIIMWVIPTVLIWINQDPEVIAAAKPFFYALSWSMLPLNIWVVIQQFLVGITRARLVMIMSIAAVPIEIFFYYVFLYGKLGLPKIGLAGVGYSLMVSYYLVSLIFVGYLYFSKQFKIYSLFKKWWVIEYKFLFEMIRVGLPMGFMWCSELVFFAIVALIMGYLGITVLAAYQIAYQYLMAVLVILFAMGQSVAVRIGNEVGENNRSRLKLILMVNMGISFGFMLIFSTFYIFFPEAAISLDGDANMPNFQEVAALAVRFLPIVAAMLITDCVRLICCGALRGLKDTTFQLILSVFGFWGIAFPSAYLLAFKFGFGSVGVLWGIVIGLFITGIMFLMRFNKLVKTVNILSLVTKK